MIRPLRRRHRTMIAALAVLVPAGLAAALAVRPRPPMVPQLPGAGPAIDCVRLDRRDLWGELPVRIRVGSSRGGGGTLIEVRLAGPLRRPDVLLYWSVALPAAGEPLPADSRLLGAIEGGRSTRFLPEEALGGGALVLYSLGHGEVAGAARLPAVPEAVPCP
jgi:hypothetical protein